MVDLEESASSRRGDREKARIDAALIAARSQRAQRRTRTRIAKQALSWGTLIALVALLKIFGVR